MIIALTGATGFIGQRLAGRLVTEGHTVRALTRQRSNSLPSSVEQIHGDLENAAALTTLVGGADALMHLAGAVRGRCLADFDGPNVEGTARLLAACRHAAPGIPILFFSSLAAREPALSHYAASKHKAEALVKKDAGGPWLVLRPPAVYGPGDREMLPVFRFMARTGLAPCAGQRSDRLSLVFVDDLVTAAVAWLPRRLDMRAVCTLHDGKTAGYGWDELAETVGLLCGRRIRVWELPRPVLDIAARANRALSGLTGHHPMLTPEKLRELRHPNWVCDNTPITTLLEWTPAMRLAEGLAATPGWRR